MKLVTLGLYAFSTETAADQMLIKTPDHIAFGQCRPINITTNEMQRQWPLYQEFTLSMQESRDLSLSEEIAQVKMGLTERSVKCYTGTEILSTLCFSQSKAAGHLLTVIKMIHRPDGSDCLYLVSSDHEK